MKFWYAYVGVFLATWAALIFGCGLLSDVLKQWSIALVMTLGSLVAGSTPMGGGAVSFPFLVLWAGISPQDARNFGLVIQALGMTSAMVFIFCRRTPVQGRMLAWTVIGAAVGMFLGSIVLAPHIASNFVKLTFACMWMSFALLTMAKSREFCSIAGIRPIARQVAMRTGLLVGIAGGVIASLIGLGVEMALYTILVLLYRCDLKIAVPTAVSAMAVTSLIGVATHLWLGDISHDVALKFLAAGPLVIFGAPIGTYIVSVVPRLWTLNVVSVLCVVQFAWTLYGLKRTAGEWTFTMLAMSLAISVFYLMYRRGKHNIGVPQTLS